jgi:Ca2+-binding EF-hand superfamily protein
VQLLQAADLGLSKKQIKLLYAEADANDDGVINYREFVQGAVTLLQTMFARKDALEEQAKNEEMAELVVERYVAHGLTREELETQIQKAWGEADKDGSGFIDAKELNKFLRALPLNLTRQVPPPPPPPPPDGWRRST